MREIEKEETKTKRRKRDATSLLVVLDSLQARVHKSSKVALGRSLLETSSDGVQKDDGAEERKRRRRVRFLSPLSPCKLERNESTHSTFP